MTRGQISRWPLTSALAGVWLVHGLYNKLLGGSPRHLAIVQSVPGLDGTTGRHALVAVGFIEVGIAVWMLSRRAPQTCASVQTVVLLSMNVLELIYARHLLLWPAGLLPLNVCFLALVWLWATPWGDLSPLRRHPVAIRATLRESVTLTYAVPASVLRTMLPPGLELDAVGDEGFVAVALVQTERLRPDGLPPALGGDFFLAGYRIFATFTQPDGRTLRGLRILRSDTDRTLMALGGNLLTHYNYHRCHAAIDGSANRLHVVVDTADAIGSLEITADLIDPSLPAGSPFATVKDARRFAGPLPFTFDYEEETDAIVAIQATRTAWHPVPVAVDVKRLAFFDQPIFRGCTPVLAAAFHVKNIDYRWERGVRHPLMPAYEVAS